MRTIQWLFLLCFVWLSASGQARAGEFEVKTIQYKNLVGRLYLPKTEAKVPAVIGFGGSDPSWGFADANGAMLASNGVAFIGLVYFKVDPALPPTLDHIPMEYFIGAVDFAETVEAIDARRLGVVSGSRGSEAGFLLAILDPRLRSVVMTTPSKVAWAGMTSARSAWTLRGQDIPALNLPEPNGGTQLQRFEVALRDADPVRAATFAFERIQGPILLISAEQDQVWPSTAMSQDIVNHLRAKNFAYPVTHKSYPTGHGFSQATAPEIKQMIVDHFIRTLGPGAQRP